MSTQPTQRTAYRVIRGVPVPVDWDSAAWAAELRRRAEALPPGSKDSKVYRLWIEKLEGDGE